MELSDEEWKKKLTPEQYRVLRQKGTEAPFSGEHTTNTKTGIYKCSACGAMLFRSESKHESKTPGLQGWPSFAEIAEVMECPYDTAKANYRHALLKLKETFETKTELRSWSNEIGGFFTEISNKYAEAE